MYKALCQLKQSNLFGAPGTMAGKQFNIQYSFADGRHHQFQLGLSHLRS